MPRFSPNRFIRWPLSLGVLLFLVLPTLGLSVQSSNAETYSAEEAVSGLTDKEVRAILIDRIAADRETSNPTEEEFNPALIVYRAQKSLGEIRRKLTAIAAAVVDLPGVFPTAWYRLTDTKDGRSFSGFLLTVFVSLIVSALAEFVFQLKTKKSFDKNMNAKSEGARKKAARLGVLGAIGLIRLVLFSTTASAVYLIFFDDSAQDRITFFFYLSALVIFRLALIASSSFYAPEMPRHRLTAFGDDESWFFHKTVVCTIALGAFGFFTCALFGTLGISGHVHGLLLIIVGTVTCGGLVLANIKGRHAIRHDMCHGLENHTVRHAIARALPWLNAVIIVAIWVGLVIAELSDLYVHYGAALLTIGALFALPSLDAILEREALRQFALKHDVAAAVLRTLRICGVFLVMVVIVRSWGIDPLMWADRGLGARVIHGLLQISMTVLLTYIVWQSVRISIDRKIAKEDEAAGGSEHGEEMEIGGEGLSRIRTLLPLLKRTIQITLFAIAGMIALASAGIDIGPILAGAGVVGLAIGFGSQTLVRDIVSGVFFLVDDAFRLGEYIDVGKAKGAVEQMSVRSLRLRHHRGAIHTIPFGEISTLTNYSRDWAIMKLKFRVPFDTDVKKVKKIFKKIGKELLMHPDIGEDFIQPFKSQGVFEVDDYGLVLRAKFTAKPGKQFMIRKEAFVAVQQAFEENGIEFAKPVIRVAVEDDDDEDAVNKTSSAIGAAASTVLSPKGA